MTVTIHKVTGGDGYDYLTEQVASSDDRRYGVTTEAYYERTGEQPGYWLGVGAADRGLVGTVDPAVMKSLWVAAATRNGERGAGVAGFDFTLSPVKSVSTLWAVAPREVQTRIEAAHRAAVAQTIGYLEQFAATRTGRGGQPDPAPGFVVAAFEHRVSRTGDPDLHTHAAVVNRAQSPDGKWRALIHLPLYEATVSASEFYNARLEDRLVADLGLAFEDRPRTDPTLRPVREIVGVPVELARAFSGRRVAIEERVAALTADRGLNHDRSIRSSARVHQWATLDTRTRKGPPLSLAQRMTGWRDVAERVLGPGGVERMLTAVRQAVHRLDPRPLADVARDIRERAMRVRTNPKPLHYRAETERQMRAHPAAIADRDQVVTAMTELAMTEPEQTDAQRRLAALADLGRRVREAKAPSRERQALTAAGDFYRSRVADSWVPTYLTTRRLTLDAVGYAPGRTSLIDHLRGQGFTPDEITRAGLARISDRGVASDWFIDRMVVPLREPSGQIIGFTGRKSPANENPNVPKYLNSPGEDRTGADVFRKREVLYGLTPAAVERLQAGAPVLIVEGPTDAAAFDVSRETLRGTPAADLSQTVVVATCGTALTRDHLLTLDRIAPLRDRQVDVVMDPDPAGRKATVKAYDLLRDFGLTRLGTVGAMTQDPAAVVETQGATALARAWVKERVPLYDAITADVLSRWPNPRGWVELRVAAMHEVAPIIAKMPAAARDRQIQSVFTALELPYATVKARVDSHVPVKERLGLPQAPAVSPLRAVPVMAPAVGRSWND